MNISPGFIGMKHTWECLDTILSLFVWTVIRQNKKSNRSQQIKTLYLTKLGIRSAQHNVKWCSKLNRATIISFNATVGFLFDWGVLLLNVSMILRVRSFLNLLSAVIRSASHEFPVSTQISTPEDSQMISHFKSWFWGGQVSFQKNLVPLLETSTFFEKCSSRHRKILIATVTTSKILSSSTTTPCAFTLWPSNHWCSRPTVFESRAYDSFLLIGFAIKVVLFFIVTAARIRLTC